MMLLAVGLEELELLSVFRRLEDMTRRPVSAAESFRARGQVWVAHEAQVLIQTMHGLRLRHQKATSGRPQTGGGDRCRGLAGCVASCRVAALCLQINCPMCSSTRRSALGGQVLCATQKDRGCCIPSTNTSRMER